MASTPPPPSTRARTPPTPLHGPGYDNYQPYSPRRSTRSTAQNNPYSSQHTDRSPRASISRHITPPTTVKKARFARAPTQLSSPPSSPASPVRHRTPQHLHKTPRKVPTSTFRQATANVAHSDSDHAAPSSSLAPPTAFDPTAMLPTPSKTPKKRNAAALHSTARILSFQPHNPNDVMPSSRKIKKHGRFNSMNGFDLYEEQDANGAEQIAVYTDTNARVPELDDGEENPFVGPKKSGPRPQRRSKKAITEEEAAMEEAAERGEGMIYNFRGKKYLRRFSDPESDRASSAGSDMGITEAPGQRTLKRQIGAAAHRPLTRSAIKPRLLFPSEEQLLDREQAKDEVDEEAVTDIEMGNALSPEKCKAVHADTPVKEHQHKPATPSTTTRTASMANRMASPTKTTPVFEDEPEPTSVGTDDSFGAQPKRGKRSPFDSWQRTKGGRKRAGDPAEEGSVAGKRTRSAVESPA